MKLIAPSTISLYVHLPWCVKKCPYCDFNSHTLRSNLDEGSYIKALLNDLSFELARLQTTPAIASIFIGGGTPSLFSGESIGKLITGIQNRVFIDDDIEITLEANPGTADETRFNTYRQVGVNRLSIGIQSFNQQHLGTLGRIHGAREAFSAVDMALSAGFTNFNLDMMYCLPQQSLEQASEDIAQAIALAPTHISAYQLTLEPNTLFAARPPVLPDDETGWQIQQTYWTALQESGYDQYEISAYSKTNRQCLHNLNYWEFGDYLGIGAGAHGKLTLSDGIFRTNKPKHPDQYLNAFVNQPTDKTSWIKAVTKADLPLEYMMNRLRLKTGFSLDHFESVTGLDRVVIAPALALAIKKDLLTETSCVNAQAQYRPSEKGRLFLDDLLQLFLPNNKHNNQQEVA